MASEILRPNAAGDTATGAGLAAVGAANIWDCVDESSPDDDTTYMSCPTGSTTYHVDLNLGPTALTSETINSIDVVHRCKENGAVHNGGNTGGIRLSGTDGTASSGGSSPSGFTAQTYTDYTNTGLNRPGGGSWAPSDLDGLQIHIGITNGLDK